MIGGLGDMRSDTFFDIEELKEFLMGSTLTKEDIESIIESYKEQGASDEVIIMELEAFAVASDIDASRIASAIDTVCPSVL